MKSISLKFDGYWPEKAKNSIPSHSGIYCVYGGTQNDNGTVTINKLIYIGESQDVNERIVFHEKEPTWRKHLAWNEVLIFSTAPILIDRVRAEAALIYRHKPPVNDEYKYSFPFDDTQMTLSGTTAQLETSFTVKSTNSTTSKSNWAYK